MIKLPGLIRNYYNPASLYSRSVEFNFKKTVVCNNNVLFVSHILEFIPVKHNLIKRFFL